MKLTLRVDHDSDVESPTDNDGAWALYSFSSRHGNYKHPEDLGLGSLDEHGDPTVTNPGLRRKLEVGLAFVLSCYQHSGIAWSLKGEGYQCRWDTARVGGILIWEHKPKDIGAKSYDDRQKDARDFLAAYNAWANGETYCYAVEDEEGETIDSCGGFIGPNLDYMWEAINAAVGENELTFEAGQHGSAEDTRGAFESYKAKLAGAK